MSGVRCSILVIKISFRYQSAILISVKPKFAKTVIGDVFTHLKPQRFAV